MPTRRAALLSALALAACGRAASADPAAELQPLKDLCPFPLGVCGMTGQFDDLGWSELVRTHFDRLTPEWEMKTEAVLNAGGDFNFTRPDRLVTLARSRGLTVFGHTLIWYAQSNPRFERLDGQGAAFAAAYERYIATIAGRYRGQLAGWDAVNEPIDDDGSLRDCLWRRNLGDDYVRLAFEAARDADPETPLLLNDYDLERRPQKRAGFLRLAEALLKAGAPLTGLGTQTHVGADLEPGAIRTTVAELGGLGLPVHISELDISVNRARLSAFRRDELERRQAALAAAAVEAMLTLPPTQRFGITIWGARDTDSWLTRGAEGRGPLSDTPLLFDSQGRPKAAALAFRAPTLVETR